MKKLTSLLLAALFVLGLAACSETTVENEGETTAASAETAEESIAEEEPDKTNMDLVLEQQGTQDLGGRVFRILSISPGKHFYYCSGTEENEVYYDESASEVLSSSIYKRNRMCEEKLNITIEPVWGGDPQPVVDTVKKDRVAGDTSGYDTALSRLDYTFNTAQGGNLLNFNRIATMDTQNPWWDESIVDHFTILGTQLYTLSGDINFYDDYAVTAIYFNKYLLEEAGLAYPYDAVREGNWTMDMMFEMADTCSRDVNGDGKYDRANDVMGVNDNALVQHYIYSYDERLSVEGEDGLPVVVGVTDSTVAAIEKILSLSENAIASDMTGSYGNEFSQDHFVFHQNTIGTVASFRDMEHDFGVAPLPKGVDTMTKYKAYVSNGWSTCYMISSAFSYDQAQEIGTVLECMSAASADLVTPALYDQLLEAKFIRDVESKEMLQYVFDSKEYDIAGDLAWGSSLCSTYNNCLTQGASSFATNMQRNSKVVTKTLQRLVDDFQALKDAEAD